MNSFGRTPVIYSFIYYKNKRELAIYSKKLSATELDIIKNIVTFQFLKVKKLLLRRKLISQNIEIIDNRINNRVISYTKMVHGVEYYIDNLFGAIKVVVNILTYTLFLYTISYIILDILNST